MLTPTLIATAETVIRAAAKNSLRIATAESCTGGLIAGCLTEIAGSSAVVDRGFVTYSNEAKIAMLDVRAETLAAHGAVSAETATEMAEGALKNSLADIAVAVTGIAGPGGGSDTKPVGLVYIAIASRKNPQAKVTRNIFPGDRSDVRQATVKIALELVLAEIV